VKLEPIFPNPVGAPIDQAWLFGEKYSDLPSQQGVSFDAPQDSLVSAAAGGVVEMVAGPGETPRVEGSDSIASYKGVVVVRHDSLTLPYGERGPVWTVYGNLSRVYVSVGERIAADDPIGKTFGPYRGTPESRALAFQFEIRAGENATPRAVNPEPMLRALDPRTGAIALKVLDANGAPLRGEAIRGAIKDAQRYARYAYSLSYQRGANSIAGLGENAYIGDLPPGRHLLEIAGERRAVDVRSGQITLIEWRVGERR
jgi:hypothetical protein